MKNLYLIANWKMNKTIAETQDFLNEFLPQVAKSKNKIIICTPFLNLQTAIQCTSDSKVKIGAQNMHYAEFGTYTGEISPLSLNELGVSYVIVGHSDRRKLYNETNETVNLKVGSAIAHGIVPILCIGESKKEHDAKRTYRVLKKQLLYAFNGIDDPTSVIIAYEPLWAISDGKSPAPTPTIAEIRSVNSGIKRVLRQIYSNEQVKRIKILYGGSVNTKNVLEIMSEKSVNGALIGGASLSVKNFVDTINAVE